MFAKENMFNKLETIKKPAVNVSDTILFVSRAWDRISERDERMFKFESNDMNNCIRNETK